MQETVQKEQVEENKFEKLQGQNRLHSLWFERVALRLRLPHWLGIPVVALAPAVSLWSLGISIRIATDFTGLPIVSLPLLILNILFLTSSSRVMCIRGERLRHYTATISVGQGPGDLRLLYRFAPIALIWAVLILASSLVFDPLIFKLYYPLYQSLLRVVVTSYIRLGQATFLWVLGYSMYSIYRWGRLPVKLKSFTEDSTLGLKPYGNTSLYFVTLYIVGVLLTFPVGVYVGEAVLISQSIFFLLGLVIFLGPLLGLRRKLVEAKQRRLDWIGTRHMRVMERVELSGEGPLDTGIVSELLVIDNIRRDVQQIHTWPFNLGVLARLVTVVMLPVFLAMIATYLMHLLQL